MTVGNNCMVLENNRDSRVARTLYDNMKSLFSTEQEIRIDGSKVDSIDVNQIEMFVSFTKSMITFEYRLTWDGIFCKAEITNIKPDQSC